jgi:tetrahydromethanopterin S-methyltransferase subunit G
LFLVVTIGGYFAIRAAVNSFVSKYTDTKPMELPKVELSKTEMEELDKRLATFKEGVEADKSVPALVLSADEINALIQRNAEMKNKVSIGFEDDQVRGKISLPLGELKVPIIGRWLKGRYLNGTAGLKPALQNGVLIVTLRSVEVNGRTIPADILASLKNRNLAEGFYSDPKTADVMSRLASIEIKDGKVTIKPRTKEGTSPPTAP